MGNSWLARLGQNPSRSWSRFKLGLAIFVVGAVLVLLGAYHWVWWQVPGLVCLAIGFSIAAVGYLGLLANRLTMSFTRQSAGVGKDKSNSPPN